MCPEYNLYENDRHFVEFIEIKYTVFSIVLHPNVDVYLTLSVS